MFVKAFKNDFPLLPKTSKISLLRTALRQFGSTTDFVLYLVGFLIHSSPYFINCFRSPICRYRTHFCKILTVRDPPYSEKFENIIKWDTVLQCKAQQRIVQEGGEQDTVGYSISQPGQGILSGGHTYWLICSTLYTIYNSVGTLLQSAPYQAVFTVHHCTFTPVMHCMLYSTPLHLGQPGQYVI